MPLRAEAAPFDITAIYEPIAGTNGSSVRYILKPDAVLPDGGEGLRLRRIVAHFNEDEISRYTLEITEQFEFRVKNGGRNPTVRSITSDKIEKLPNRDFTLIEWNGGHAPGDPVARLEVEVLAKAEGPYLCTREADLRSTGGKEVAKSVETWLAQRGKPGANAAPQEVEKGVQLAFFFVDKPKKTKQLSRYERALIAGTHGNILLDDNKNEIAWSFCRSNDTAYWKLISSESQLCQDEDDETKRLSPDRCKKKHREAALGALQASKSLTPGGLGKLEPENESLVARMKMTVNVLRAFGAFLLYEEMGSEVIPLSNIVDSDSRIILGLDRDVCLAMPQSAFDSPFIFEFEVPIDEAKTNTTKLSMAYVDNCRRDANTDLGSHVDKNATLKVRFRIDDDNMLTLKRSTFEIKELGFVTAFPGVTDIIAAVQGDSLESFKANSRVNVAWAIPTKGGNTSGAVILPWEIGFNSRRAPNFAKFITFYGMLGYLLKEDQESAREDLLIGGGISLARMFYFSVATNPLSEQGSEPYVLIGLAPQQIAALLR